MFGYPVVLWSRCWVFWPSSSVGAISGYSKAMLKYKLNKQAEQISTLINTGLRYTESWNFSQNESVHLIPYFIKLGEVPKEMIKNSSTIVYDIFDTEIQLTYSKASSSLPVISFFIRLDTTRYNDTYNLSICYNLVNIIKEFRANLLTMQMINGGLSDNYEILSYYGDAYCTGNRKCLKNMTMKGIDEFCRYNLGKTELPHLKLMWYAN